MIPAVSPNACQNFSSDNKLTKQRSRNNTSHIHRRLFVSPQLDDALNSVPETIKSDVCSHFAVMPVGILRQHLIRQAVNLREAEHAMG